MFCTTDSIHTAIVGSMCSVLLTVSTRLGSVCSLCTTDSIHRASVGSVCTDSIHTPYVSLEE